MKRTNYVPTSLSQYLNENRSITLTRKYGEKDPVVVGSRAPLRNQVLAYVLENKQVSRKELREFINTINEGKAKPAATNMWLKRNSKFFIAENKNGITTYKLSKLGEKLASRIIPATSQTGSLSEEQKATSLLENENSKDSRRERIKKLIEEIKERELNPLYESDDEDLDDEDKEDDETPSEDTDDKDEDKEDDIDSDDEDKEDDEDSDDEDKEDDTDLDEDDDRVEITEFVISVDDPQAAIEELRELGIEAEEFIETPVEDDLSIGDELPADETPVEDDDLGLDDETPTEGDDEIADFDLDLGGEIEGEDTEAPDMEESVTGMRREEKAKTPNLTEEDEDPTDELSMDDLDVPGEEETMSDELPADDEIGDENTELDDELPADDDVPADDLDMAPAGEKQIRVPAEHWEKLKAWLESKDVDTEELFGGEIEIEGEIEDGINFDKLEELPDDEGKKENADDDLEDAAEDDEEAADDLEDAAEDKEEEAEDKE